jgi:hypothetical protein
MPDARKENVLAVDYHRNGVGGEGFYVGIIADQEEPGGPVSRKLVVAFDMPECAVAVLDLKEAYHGNIFMHPQPAIPGSGGNAWRGDHYAGYLEVFRAMLDERWG